MVVVLVEGHVSCLPHRGEPERVPISELSFASVFDLALICMLPGVHKAHIMGQGVSNSAW